MRQAIFDLIDYLPIWIKLLAASLFLLFATFFFTPYVTILQHLSSTHIATNEPTAFDKIRAFKEYVRYSYRAMKYDGIDSETPPLIRNRAALKGFDKDGFIHLDVYTMNGKMSAKGWLADVEIHDKKLALSIIKKESSKAVVVDTYKIDRDLFFVIWLHDGTPLNETLILNSAGKPTTTPPTNIVNSLFKEHYNLIAFGK